MDRRHTFRLLIAAFTLAVATVAARATADLPIGDARWIAPGRDPVRLLTTEPGECLALPADPQARQSIEIGRAAFRDPLLLGGVAARVGLACAGCHQAGHGNPDFHFPGLSGAPGTVDTTSAVTSEHRDDARFNPRPIPSLVAGERSPTVSRSRAGVLERFIHGLIVDEFDGAEPAPKVLAGLADYVRALRQDACGSPLNRITVAGRIDDAVRAIDAAARALDADDPATARAMMGSARSMLGMIAERLSPPVPAAARAEMLALGREIGSLRNRPSSTADLQALRARLLAVRANAPAWQSLSLFDPGRVSEALRAP